MAECKGILQKSPRSAGEPHFRENQVELIAAETQTKSLVCDDIKLANSSKLSRNRNPSRSKKGSQSKKENDNKNSTPEDKQSALQHDGIYQAKKKRIRRRPMRTAEPMNPNNNRNIPRKDKRETTETKQTNSTIETIMSDNKEFVRVNGVLYQRKSWSSPEVHLGFQENSRQRKTETECNHDEITTEGSAANKGIQGISLLKDEVIKGVASTVLATTVAEQTKNDVGDASTTVMNNYLDGDNVAQQVQNVNTTEDNAEKKVVTDTTEIIDMYVVNQEMDESIEGGVHIEECETHRLTSRSKSENAEEDIDGDEVVPVSSRAIGEYVAQVIKKAIDIFVATQVMDTHVEESGISIKGGDINHLISRAKNEIEKATEVIDTTYIGEAVVTETTTCNDMVSTMDRPMLCKAEPYLETTAKLENVPDISSIMDCEAAQEVENGASEKDTLDIEKYAAREADSLSETERSSNVKNNGEGDVCLEEAKAEAAFVKVGDVAANNLEIFHPSEGKPPKETQLVTPISECSITKTQTDVCGTVSLFWEAKLFPPPTETQNVTGKTTVIDKVTEKPNNMYAYMEKTKYMDGKSNIEQEIEVHFQLGAAVSTKKNRKGLRRFLHACRKFLVATCTCGSYKTDQKNARC